MTNKKFFKAPRYLLRKHNILSIVRSRNDIKSFMDVGCGAGELACTLAENGLNGVGLDFSDEAISIANGIKKERNLRDDQIIFKNDTVDFTNKKYDLIISCEVLEHVENDEDLLKKLINKSNKYVLLSVPARMKYFDQSDVKVGHFRRYEKNELIALIENNGLEIIDFRAYGYPFVNIVRIIRKPGFNKIKNQENMEESTKKSGINPIEIPGPFKKLDLEKLFKLPYFASLPFNRLNLSEGYLVLARKK